MLMRTDPFRELARLAPPAGQDDPRSGAPASQSPARPPAARTRTPTTGCVITS